MEDRSLPYIRKIDLDGNDWAAAFVSIKPNTYPEYIKHFMKCDQESLLLKSEELERGKREIKYCLAGYAAEVLTIPKRQSNFIYLQILNNICKLEEKDIRTDLNKAISLNVAMNLQQPSDSYYPLLKLFKDTILNMYRYRNDIFSIPGSVTGTRITTAGTR